MIEVEIKLPVFKRSMTERELKRIGFEPGDLIRESDLYYTSSFHDFMKTDEALRIRTATNLTKQTETSFLTYKGKKLDQISMTRKELEIQVSDPDIMSEILHSLGYQHLFPVNKLRQHYHRDQITACVDQVEKLGSFLEFEILVNDPEDHNAALEELKKILKSIGEDFSSTTTRSYLSMLMQKKNS